MNASAARLETLKIGVAGWSIPRSDAADFPARGSHLERYAARFTAVEINSSFYRPHRPDTYRRWAGSVPDGFRFAVKLPREITHEGHLRDSKTALVAFLSQVTQLGVKLGPILVQLPPDLAYTAITARAFFKAFRARFGGPIVCEPRHATWFTPAAEETLVRFDVARVAADPAVVPAAAIPGGAADITYRRLHGSPRMYVSSYDVGRLYALATVLKRPNTAAEQWCIFDNTARGAANGNALQLMMRLKIRRR